MQHPAQGGRAGEHLSGADADRRSVLDMAPRRIGRVPRRPRRDGRRRSGNVLGLAGRPRGDDGVGADMHHDLVQLRVIGGSHLPGQELLGNQQQRVGQTRGGRWLVSAQSLIPVRRFRGNVGLLRRLWVLRVGCVQVAQVSGRCAQRLQQDRPGQRRQPERPGQRPIVLEPPRQPAPDSRRGVIGRADLPVRSGEPLQLAARHRPGDLGEARLGLRRGDPGQRPHL